MGPNVRRRRFTAIKQADFSAISGRDVYDIAAIFLREHGARAARQAGEWSDLMLDRDDRNGHATWRRILSAIEELRHRCLCRAESQTSAERPSLRAPRLYSDIDRTLEHVIRKALSAARDTGEDDLAQTERALRAARQVRPALSVPDALSAVAMARRR